MVQTFQQTTEILQLLFDGRCPRYVGVQSLRCCRGEDLCAPTVAARTLSTTPCIWQSLVRCSPVEHAVFSASWFTNGYMTTSVYVVVLLADSDAPRAVFPCMSAFVADNSGSARLVLLVTKQLALFSPFPSSGPRCATSWPVWTRRTENAPVAHLQAPCI